MSSKVLLTEGRSVQENLAVVAEPFAEMLQSGNVLWKRCEGQWMSHLSSLEQKTRAALKILKQHEATKQWNETPHDTSGNVGSVR